MTPKVINGFQKEYIPWNKGKKLGFIPKMAFKKNDPRLMGKNNPSWNSGKPKCIDCGKELSTYKNKTNCCCKCYTKHVKREYPFKKGHIPWNNGLKGYTNKGTFKIGHKHSKKTLKKMILNSARYWLGKKRPNLSLLFKINPPRGMLGKKQSIETREKIGNAHRGEKSNLWKGGISKNKEYIKKYRREYYYRYPTKKLHNQKRMFIRKGGGELSIQTIQQVYENNIKQYGTLTCYLCLKPIEFKQDSLEHKTPLIRGGTNEYNNLAIAHRICNSKKHNKTEIEYREVINA